MKYEDLPAHWSTKLERYLYEQIGVNRRRPNAYDFHSHLKISFADRSYALFHYAFYIIDEEGSEVGIFTEHCGYHIFPLCDTKIEVIESGSDPVVD